MLLLIRQYLCQCFSAQNASWYLLLCLTYMAIVINTPAYATSNQDQESQQKNKARLSDIQQAIAKQESNIYDANQQRTALEEQLKRDDLAIATTAKKINIIENNLKATHLQIAKLVKEESELTQRKNNQETLLAQQLRSAYTTGQHDYLKLLLNQDKSDEIQRTISYYQYLNKARIQEIDNFKDTIAQLIKVSSKHQQEIKHLETLKSAQLQQSTQLKVRKKQRSSTLKKLSQALLSSQQKLSKLKIEENNLNSALEKLAAQIKIEADLIGLSKLRRKLSWPIKGKILHSFGTNKQGYLKWKGVLLSAPVGRHVKTIHNGTVLFSDWLKGYGLLTVIDHGDGYMSLYAHNQALLKSVGDRVETGEPIALVGQSGGQNVPGLYFEIRHQGKAVNPKLWCK